MDSFPGIVQKVKAQKANAGALQRRRTAQLKTLMHVLEAVVALLLLLSWCTGGGLLLAVDAAVDRSLRLFHLFRKPLSIFLLSNGIIIAIALLSGAGDRKRKTGPAADFSEKIYDEYLSRRGTSQVAAVPEETTTDSLQIVPYVAEPTKATESARVTEPAKAITPVKASEPGVSRVSPSSALVAGVERERHYRRTTSALAVRPCRQDDARALRRTVTVINGRRVPVRSSPVDDLTNEEFNRTVENYIARTRLVLRRELMAELPASGPNKSHSQSNMAVIVRN